MGDGISTLETTGVLVSDLLQPRLLVCVAGAYTDGTRHRLSPESARGVIGASQTNALVINASREALSEPQTLPIWEILEAFVKPTHVVPLLNTSRASCAAEAIEMIRFGEAALGRECNWHFHRAPLFKLEILDKKRCALNDETLLCLKRLEKDIRCKTLPIFNPDCDAVEEAIEMGCPAVRLLCGRIGECKGILDPASVSRAISRAQKIPVILEGGIATPDHIHQSAMLGAAGVLMNSVFLLPPDPIAKAHELRQAADQAPWRFELAT